MSFETITYEVTEGVATLTLNRPESYNAINQPMIDELKQAFRQIERDNAVRAVVLTGAGKAFCSGADVREIGANGSVAITEYLRNGLNILTMTMRSLEKPVLACVNGAAAGAGMSLAMAADFRIAADSATFIPAAFINIGLVPDAGLTYTLTQMVGPNKALELALLFDGKNRLTATDAQQLGLVNRLSSIESLAEDTTTLARRLASLPTKTVGLTKRAINRSLTTTLAEALDYEARLQGIAFSTADHREGVTAFLEKRAPQFTGQ